MQSVIIFHPRDGTAGSGTDFESHVDPSKFVKFAIYKKSVSRFIFGLVVPCISQPRRDWLRLIWSAGRHINSFSAGNWTSRWERRRDNVRRLLIHIRVRSMEIASNTFFYVSTTSNRIEEKLHFNKWVRWWWCRLETVKLTFQRNLACFYGFHHIRTWPGNERNISFDDVSNRFMMAIVMFFAKSSVGFPDGDRLPLIGFEMEFSTISPAALRH